MIQRIEWNIKFSSLSILHINHEVFFELNINSDDYENNELKLLSRYVLEYIDIKLDHDYKCKRTLFIETKKKDQMNGTLIDIHSQKLKVWCYYRITIG